MPSLYLGILYAVHANVEFIIVLFNIAAVFRTPVRQDADKTHFLCGKERQNLVIEQVGPGDGSLGGVELGRGPPRVCRFTGCGHALDGLGAKRVLAAEVTGWWISISPQAQCLAFYAPERTREIPSAQGLPPVDFFSNAARRCFMDVSPPHPDETHTGGGRQRYLVCANRYCPALVHGQGNQ